MTWVGEPPVRSAGAGRLWPDTGHYTGCAHEQRWSPGSQNWCRRRRRPKHPHWYGWTDAWVPLDGCRRLFSCMSRGEYIMLISVGLGLKLGMIWVFERKRQDGEDEKLEEKIRKKVASGFSTYKSGEIRRRCAS